MTGSVVIKCSCHVPEMSMTKWIGGNNKMFHEAEACPPVHDRPLITRTSFTLSAGKEVHQQQDNYAQYGYMLWPYRPST